MNKISIRAIVEAEKGSSRRAVFDEHLKVINFRDLNAPYPFAYGFILKTISEDGDWIDCYILTDKQLKVGMIVDCVPIGLLEVYENEEADCKIICVLEGDDFSFGQKHIEQIKNFILQIFKKYADINIKFGEYKDDAYAVNYINERMTT